MKSLIIILSGAFVLFIVASCSNSDKNDSAKKADETVAENEVASNPLNDVYWGDTHLHTSQSFDAIAFGTIVGPEEAYRFARGEEITSSTGLQAKLSRPLDFLVVADHAEAMGVMGEIKEGNPLIMGNETLKKWNKWLNTGDKVKAMDVYREIMASQTPAGTPLPDELTNLEIMSSIWKKNIDAAEKYN
ncbi:MAG: hypothetical protein ACI9FN_001540, partial [Saprospiraceae bacterium]